MSLDLSEAYYGVLAGDAAMAALLNTYQGQPAVFTTEPAPGNAKMPYIIAAGEVAQDAWDTKQTRGRMVTRDIRCYTAASGSAITVERIAERARELFHRQEVTIDGYRVVIAECSGPLVADEQDAYGRIVTVRQWIERD